MTTITQAIDAISGSTLARATVDLAQSHRPSGLGPKQLAWLRANVDAFRHAEEQRRQVRLDVLRSLRQARMIS